MKVTCYVALLGVFAVCAVWSCLPTPVASVTRDVASSVFTGACDGAIGVVQTECRCMADTRNCNECTSKTVTNDDGTTTTIWYKCENDATMKHCTLTGVATDKCKNESSATLCGNEQWMTTNCGSLIAVMGTCTKNYCN